LCYNKYVKKISFLVLIFVFTPLVSFGHGSPFFEFNPDNSSFLYPVSVDSPSEIFMPQNDFLGGLDLWLDNSGSSGTATFELRNQAGTLVASKTATIPTISPIAGGQRFHIDFNQIAVTNNSNYTLRIITGMPNLRIHYSSRIQFIGHNAPYSSQYINGVANIDSEEREFSFKFALYETFETVPPVLSNISTTPVSTNQTRLDFNSTEPVDYSMAYGLAGQGYNQNINFSGAYQYCGPGIDFCSIAMSTIPDQTYNYILTVRDIWGNQVQAAGSFDSGEVSPAQTVSPTPTPIPSGTPDSSPLVISDFFINEATDRSVEVSWHTDRAANSYLLISFSSDFITVTAVSDNTFELEHLLKTGDVLDPNKTYFARVTSYDAFGSVASQTIAFTTLKVPSLTPTPLLTPTPPPPPSPIPPSPIPPPDGSPTPAPTPLPENNVLYIQSGNGFYTVQWSTSSGGEPEEGYRVDIFDNNKNLIKQITLPRGVSEATITGIPDGEYYAVVYADEGRVMEKVGPPTSLKIGDEDFTGRLLALWPYLTVVIAALILFVFRDRLLKLIRKPAQPPIK